MSSVEDSQAPQLSPAGTGKPPVHHHGIGSLLTRRLGVLASERGFHTFVARILPDNRAALGLVRKLVLVNALGLGRPKLRMAQMSYGLVTLPRVGEAVMRFARDALQLQFGDIEIRALA